MGDLANDKPRLEKSLSSDFANKAPAALVAKEREKLDGYKDTAEKIKSQLKQICRNKVGGEQCSAPT